MFGEVVLFLLSFLGERVLSIVADTDYCSRNWSSCISKCLLGTGLLKIKLKFPSFPYSHAFELLLLWKVINYLKM